MATANIGFEETLWKAADKLRGSMDSGEYKHVVLGLIFVKYISDKFETKYNELLEEGDGFEEDRDEYTYENIFWVPKEARWEFIRDNAKDPKIGQIIDDAMILIEKENLTLKGVLDKRYARPELDKRRLGELIDLISTIKLHQNGEKDLLGRVYEYFLGQFASSEGKGGGEFYTPTSVVKTLVEMIEPYEGRIYDPACGSGGMFIQSEKFVEEHKGKIENLSIYGQELNSTTWKLCRMNLAIRGLDGNLGPHHDDTFHNDLHKTLKADYILANPPFNISDWGGNKLAEDVRWKYGTPPEGNANYAWLQHMVYHLAPNGCAGIVLANGALSSNTSNEGEIRKNLVEGKLVDAIVALPDKLFYSTGIPVSLWILNRNKKDNPKFRSREDEILFIDARNLGTMVDRRHRELNDDDIKKISETYHNYRNINGTYEDVQGFCKKAILDEVRENEHVLTPGRYVGIEEAEDDGIPFDEKMEALTSELGELFAKSRRLEDEIRKNLGELDMSFNLSDKSEVINDNHWEELKLDEVCELITRGITPAYTEKNGVLVINQKCIRDNRVNLELARLTNPEKKKIPEQKYLKEYDVLVNSTGVGTLGRVAQIKNIKKKLTVDSHVTIVRANKKVHSEFLGYNLFMQQPNIEHLAEGSTGQTELSRTRLGEAIKILMPSFEEQKTIANIFSNIDKKIDINNTINKKLEEMAQAIFKQWFVDFEFPNEDGEPYKSSGGEMVESELGMIPKGWKIGAFGDIIEISSGKRPSKKATEKSGEYIIPLAGASSIMGYVEEYNYNEPILIIGRVGTHGIIQRFNKKVWASDNTLVIKSKYYEYTNQILMTIDYNSLNRGSTQPLITQTDIKNQKIAIPVYGQLMEFEKMVGTLYAVVNNKTIENENLIKLRDTLLPKLMSGEVRVPLE